MTDRASKGAQILVRQRPWGDPVTNGGDFSTLPCPIGSHLYLFQYLR